MPKLSNFERLPKVGDTSFAEILVAPGLFEWGSSARWRKIFLCGEMYGEWCYLDDGKLVTPVRDVRGLARAAEARKLLHSAPIFPPSETD
jgi:hypothetical protein